MSETCDVVGCVVHSDTARKAVLDPSQVEADCEELQTYFVMTALASLAKKADRSASEA